MKRFAMLLGALALITASAFAADEYKIDPAHSTVGFNVKHMMVSTVPGRFTQFEGVIVYDDKDPSKSSVTATIKTASITTDNEARDKHLKTGDFFEVEKYPEIKFVSKKVEKRGDKWVAIGDLTMKDVTKQVEIPFELNKMETPRGKVIGVDGELKINRQDYHVTWQRPLQQGMGVTVSDEVKITLNLEARTAPPAQQQPAAGATPKKQ
jgi:polyisoprenoid-binding protein YceI